MTTVRDKVDRPGLRRTHPVSGVRRVGPGIARLQTAASAAVLPRRDRVRRKSVVGADTRKLSNIRLDKAQVSARAAATRVEDHGGRAVPGAPQMESVPSDVDEMSGRRNNRQVYSVASHWYVPPVSAMTTIRLHRPTTTRIVLRRMSTSPVSKAPRFGNPPMLGSPSRDRLPLRDDVDSVRPPQSIENRRVRWPREM